MAHTPPNRSQTARGSAADPDVLADAGYGVRQGGVILARMPGDPKVTARHVREFRTYLELLFGVEEAASGSGVG